MLHCWSIQLYTCHNPLSQTCPLSESLSDAQMADTLCSICTVGQWSRAHYLHYLQRTDGQVATVTQPTEHLQCWGGAKSSPNACRCWQKQISKTKTAVYSSQLYSEMLSLQPCLQSNSHASFVPIEPLPASRTEDVLTRFILFNQKENWHLQYLLMPWL